MTSLLGASAHIDSALPSFARDQEGRKPLAKIFKDSRIWFNHALKVRNQDLINVRYLWRFITRGAMILCANCTRGVDLVVPICYSGNVLSRRTVTAILIQVKNDTRFGQVSHGYLFDGMNLFLINLFDQAPLPIIRMVFALASTKSAVNYVPGRQSWLKDEKRFTSYDIWCAGTSLETFPIIKDDGPAYLKLLDRTCSPGHEYDVRGTEVTYPEDVSKKKSNLLRLFNPLLENGVEHQQHFIEEECEGGPPATSSA